MKNAVYTFKEDEFNVTDEMKKNFDDMGYILVRNLLSKAELERIKLVVEGDNEIIRKAYDLYDDEGKECSMSLWMHPGSDVTGMLARSVKVVDTCEKLLDGEVYHYHSKLMMKNAHTGGSFLWHQDYGYWYNNGCLFPDMMTVFVAIDKCTRENGCLQILPGSHKCGRVEHKLMAGQTGADPERVAEIIKKCPTEQVEMKPGDALFFHCNVLHKSNRNPSPHRRWALLMAYNKRSNDPYIKEPLPTYTKIDKVPNSAILTCTNITDMSEKDFMDAKRDKQVRTKETKDRN